MRRVQLGGAVDIREPFVLSDDDFDAFERAGRMKLTATARSSLQAACDKFLKSSILAKGKPKEAEVRSLLTKLEAGLRGTSSAFHDLAASNDVAEAASIWLKHNWLGDVQTIDLVCSVELAHASVQKALRELGLIVAGATKGPEPNPYRSSFVIEVQRIYEDAGGSKTFQAFADAVIGALPGRGHFGHSPDKRAKKQQLARAQRTGKRRPRGDK